jgi:hypothetical protein
MILHLICIRRTLRVGSLVVDDSNRKLNRALAASSEHEAIP